MRSARLPANPARASGEAFARWDSADSCVLLTYCCQQARGQSHCHAAGSEGTTRGTKRDEPGWGMYTNVRDSAARLPGAEDLVLTRRGPAP